MAEEKYTWKKAGLSDLELLTETRIQVLLAANRLPGSTDMSEVRRGTRRYYEEALADGSHTAYLVFDGDRFIGAGGVSYYRVMPTYHSPSGKKAYIMNMYTDPAYRRQGIALRTLDLLIEDARSREVSVITLEATDMGRALYERYGFTAMTHEMELIENE